MSLAFESEISLYFPCFPNIVLQTIVLYIHTWVEYFPELGIHPLNELS